MGVLLQGFYKKQSGVAVPSRADGDVSVPFCWDRLASQANELRKVGSHGRLGSRPSSRPYPQTWKRMAMALSMTTTSVRVIRQGDGRIAVEI